MGGEGGGTMNEEVQSEEEGGPKGSWKKTWRTEGMQDKERILIKIEDGGGADSKS